MLMQISDENDARKVQKSSFAVGQIPDGLACPGLVGIRRASGKVPRRVANSMTKSRSALGPDLARREVQGSQHIPVGFEQGGFAVSRASL
jgi:hypothetical protein